MNTNMHNAAQDLENVDFLDVLARPFVAIGRAIGQITEAHSRLGEIERLQSLSDTQLAKLGLKRTDIHRHVFRDLLYV